MKGYARQGEAVQRPSNVVVVETKAEVREGGRGRARQAAVHPLPLGTLGKGVPRDCLCKRNRQAYVKPSRGAETASVAETNTPLATYSRQGHDDLH